MAIKAKAEITISHMIDVLGTYRYYLLQSSTASAPAKPTTYPPSSSWDDSEPTYTSGSTNSLYFVDCSVYSNNTFYYSPVSLSSAYEASKQAYNQAVRAMTAANSAQSSLEIANDVIIGTQTAATGSWTGVAEFSELKHGQSIMYWLPYAGSGNATLNLTLSNGSTTGAKNLYYGGTTRLTTHYPAGSLIRLVYLENAKINSSTYTGWWADANYDSGNTYDRTRYQQVIKCGTSAIASGNIIVGANGLYNHLKSGTAFDISYPILYASSAISASGTGNNNYIVIPFTVTTTQSITLTAYKPVYIKGKLSGQMFTPVSTAPLTQTVPTSADGYDYMLLGQAYSTTAMYLVPEHPMFRYHDGAFKSFEQIAVEGAQGAEEAKDAAENAQNTANSALNAASAAQSTANGKNTVFYQASAPSTSGRKTNDIWFDTDDGNKMYYWSGSAWTAQQFGQGAIAYEAISTNHLVAGAVTAAKMSVESLSTITANLGHVTAGVMQSENFAMSDYSVAEDGTVTGTVTAGLKIDLNNKAYYTPHITMKDNYIDLNGYMTIGKRSNTGAIGKYSFTQGTSNIASGTRSHAEGFDTTASGDESHAEGYDTNASGNFSHAEGHETEASGKASHAEGWLTKASGDYSHAEGSGDALANYSHAEGTATEASGASSHTEGHYTKATAQGAHAEGTSTEANGISSHSEGDSTVADGRESHSEGSNTVASGRASHSEGFNSIASGNGAHAEGGNYDNEVTLSLRADDYPILGTDNVWIDGSTAEGESSHAEGTTTYARGIAAHSEGYTTAALGNYSHAEGLGTIAYSESQHVQGKYNLADLDGTYAHIVGNGTDAYNNRSNAYTLDWSGNAWFAGKVTSASRIEGQTISTTSWIDAGGDIYSDKNICGAKLQGANTPILSTAATKFAVLDSSGWLYYRKASQILSDIGAAASSHTHSEYALASHTHAIAEVTNLSRLFCSMVPYGTAIPENADLNTTAYMKVGNYYCSSNATTKTLTNCPTVTYNSSGTATAGVAFMMQVYSPLSTTIDNEATKTWIYRLRKLTSYTGDEFIQYCYVDGTANHWIYGAWRKVLHQPTYGTAIGSSTKPIYISSNGVPTACSTYAGGTAVTLNGSSKGGSTASFYAPTAAGTSGNVLVSAGSGAPTWKSLADAGIAASGHTHSEYALASHTHTLDYRLQAAQSTATGSDANVATATGFHYINGTTNRPPFNQNNGVTGNDYRILTTAYSASWLQQIATDFRCDDIYYRRNQNGTWQSWRKLAFADEHLSSKGGTVSGNLVLYAESGDSPKLIFQRGDNTGTVTDWNMVVSSGTLKFNTVSASGSTDETTIAEFGYNGVLNIKGSIQENGTALSSKYAPLSHTHSYLPLSGGTLTGELLISTGTTQSATKGIKWSAINSKNPYIGYATDQIDGTFVVGSLLGTNYASGLAIGGGSGNLLWKGNVVLNASNYTSYCAPASHTHNYLPLSGGKLTGILNFTENMAQINFRPGHASYDGVISYQTSGNEAMVFSTKNAVTSFMFVNGEDTITNISGSRWQSLTPGLQIKNNCVAIGKQIANGVTPTYTLDVGGTAYVGGNVIVPNATSYSTLDSSGTRKPLMCLSSSNHITIGDPASGNPVPGGFRVYTPNGSMTFTSNGGTLQWYAYANSTTGTSAIFNTSADNIAMLGSSSYRWYRLYQTASSISTSDKREKSDIMAMADYPVAYLEDGEGNVWERLFNGLVPKTYTLNDEKSDDVHFGFIAQEIEEAMEELGLTVDDLGIINHEYWTDEETGEERDRYGLAYEEFTALNTYIIQKQGAQIEKQQDMIQKQQNEISTLEERIEKLEELLLN